MKFVLASHNQGKLAEMQRILGQLGVEVVLQSELGLALEPEETGTTFTENARIKAEAVMQASGLPAIADDSGLCVDALNGAPGVYSARYGGLDDDVARYRLLLENLRGAGPVPPTSTRRWFAASPTGTCWRPRATATARSPMPRRGRTASATTRCSSCRSCERPSPS